MRVLACAHACGCRRVCLLRIRVAQWKDVITQSQAVGRGLGGGRGQANQGGPRLAPRPARGVKQRPGFRTGELSQVPLVMGWACGDGAQKVSPKLGTRFQGEKVG